jgi:hypothetical protein
VITPDEARQLRLPVDETETELDRVFSYYKVNSLKEMRAATAALSSCSIVNEPNNPKKPTAMPKIERLEQNTSEWLRWRLQGIESSDAPVIMGEAAFKTRRRLWAIKT